jgi:hypothetical protein
MQVATTVRETPVAVAAALELSEQMEVQVPGVTAATVWLLALQAAQ